MTNTLFKRVAPENMNEGARAAYEGLNDLTGDATFVEVFAQAPELLNFAMVEFYQKLFFEGRVADKYMQLGRLRMSMGHGCRSCNLQNLPMIKAIGYSDVQVDAMWAQDYSGFPEDEAAVMELADQIALNNRDGELTVTLFEKLKRHFSEEEILNICMCMGVIVGLVKMSFATGLVMKESYCEFGTSAAA
jgi:alkylhydroperoxidase family enzyme